MFFFLNYLRASSRYPITPKHSRVYFLKISTLSNITSQKLPSQEISIDTYHQPIHPVQFRQLSQQPLLFLSGPGTIEGRALHLAVKSLQSLSNCNTSPLCPCLSHLSLTVIFFSFKSTLSDPQSEAYCCFFMKRF